LRLTETELGTSIHRLAESTDQRLRKLNEQLNKQINMSEEHICALSSRVQNILIDFSNKTAFQFEATKESSSAQTKSFKTTVMTLQDAVEQSFNELGRANKHDLDVFERAVLDRFEAVQAQFVQHEGMLKTASAENEKRLGVVVTDLGAQNESLHREVRSMQVAMNNLTGLLIDISSRMPSKSK
jgi:DNA anti-recombination protein RmuC